LVVVLFEELGKLDDSARNNTFRAHPYVRDVVSLAGRMRRKIELDS